ncbi:hypothetical protein ACG94X_15715 [Acinetobacter sp. ULE_I010]|uniref:hypothetical protein n=1 Tax=Acinetobacter sp. ULE_I010 TaxID=3373065 RepID=UPI003AF6A77D
MKNNRKKIIPIIIISIILAILIFYITPLGNQYEFTFFHITLSRTLSYVLCIIILAPLALIIIDSFYARDIEQQRHTFRYRKTKKMLTYLIFIFMMLLLIAYFSIGLSRIVLYTNNYMLIKSNELIGEKAIEEFIMEFRTELNPTFNQKINIGSVKNTRYIIDPTPYKLSITLHDDKHNYPLKEYCFKGNEPPLLQQKSIYISGYYSFMGFSANQNQHLSDHFTNNKGERISHLNLNICEFIYRSNPK